MSEQPTTSIPPLAKPARSAARLSLALALALLVCVLAALLFSRARLNALAEARALHLTEEVFANQRTSSLMLYAHPALFRFTRELDWPAHTADLRTRLGALREIRSIRRDTVNPGASAATTPDSGLRSLLNPQSITYRLDANFASGPAEIVVSFLRNDEEWLASEFRVLADATSS